MNRSRRLWAFASIVAFVGVAMAASAALAYDRPAETPRATVVATAEEADPGIDFMITGPVGRGKIQLAEPAISSARAEKSAVRHRMRLK